MKNTFSYNIVCGICLMRLPLISRTSLFYNFVLLCGFVWLFVMFVMLGPVREIWREEGMEFFSGGPKIRQSIQREKE